MQGKRALVTGSTAGIGWATARALAAEGAAVALNVRTETRVWAVVEAVCREVPDARVHGVAADVSSAAGCEALIAHVPGLDVLVNNMGIFEPRPFAEITDAEWWEQRPADVLWLGGEVFGRIQDEARVGGYDVWANLDEYGRSSFDKEGARKLIRELEALAGRSTNEFVREGSRQILRRLRSFLVDQRATFFNIEGP